MVMVRLYNSPRPHGMVHVEEGCWHTHRSIRDDPPEGYGWEWFASAEDTDRELPGRTLYWCSLRGCFGPDNPRRMRR